MKKKYWITALASVAFVSCVNEVPVSDDNNQQLQELKFGLPVMSTQSRTLGEIVGAQYPDDENFVVYAVMHNGAFSGWENSFDYQNKLDEDQTNNTGIGNAPFFPKNGVVVSKSAENNYWHINGDVSYYWPKNEVDEDKNPTTDYRMTFAAFSPASLLYPAGDEVYCDDVTYSKAGLDITGYQMPDKPSNHFDILFSTRTTDAVTSPVAINFKHALSSIRFMFVKQAYTTGGVYKVNIKKIDLIGEIFNKGDFKQTITSVDNSSGNPKWENLQIIKDTDPIDANKQVTKIYTLYNDNFSVPEGSSVEIQGISSFMPIPQGVNDKMKVRIEYDVIMHENGAAEPDEIEIPFTDFLLPSSSNYISRWERGNRYVYTVQFGALKEIFFAPIISEDWVTTNNTSFYSIGKVQNEVAVTE